MISATTPQTLSDWLLVTSHNMHYATYLRLCDQRRAEEEEFRTRAVVVGRPQRRPSAPRRKPSKRGGLRK